MQKLFRLTVKKKRAPLVVTGLLRNLERDRDHHPHLVSRLERLSL